MNNETLIQKHFPNGDAVVDFGHGPIYCTPEAAYSVELDPPGHPLSDEPFGVNLVRTTHDEYGVGRVQRLTLAEYYSYMAAEEHVREVEDTLLEQGRDGLQMAMDLVDKMPVEPDTATYLVGLYPPDPEADLGTLNLIRLDGERLDIAPVAHGRIAELVPVEQRLFDVQAEGNPGILLEAATLEAMRADELAPYTPLFAFEGEDMNPDKPISLVPKWEDHPDWPDVSAWNEPPAPKSSALVLPVTFDDAMTPFDEQGRYVPNHHDEAGTVHFFSVIERPSDSLLQGNASHELCYFRACQTGEGIVVHDSQPVMPVEDPTTSPWPLPALQLHLEEGDLAAAQSLARETAHDNGLPFPDTLSPLGTPETPHEQGWYHFDTELVLAAPQGIDDGYSVGVVDVYANHENEQWAARYLPLGEFDTFDEALAYQQQALFNRLAEDRESAVAVDGFNQSPLIYERIARAETDAALTDLLEQHDGHYPPDYDGDQEPEWEPLTSTEWDAYRDQVLTISEVVPGAEAIHDNLPTTTPGFANDALVAMSQQSAVPYLLPDNFKHQVIDPDWRLEIVPARDPDGTQLGYAAVCVVDFSDLADTLSPDEPQCGQWLEIAQFQTEERAQQFRGDFMSLVELDDLGHIAGPALATVVADDLGMESEWQIMNKDALEKLKAEEWSVTHKPDEWRPRLDEISPQQAIETANLELEL
jgi:hypothetical protein